MMAQSNCAATARARCSKIITPRMACQPARRTPRSDFLNHQPSTQHEQAMRTAAKSRDKKGPVKSPTGAPARQAQAKRVGDSITVSGQPEGKAAGPFHSLVRISHPGRICVKAAYFFLLRARHSLCAVWISQRNTAVQKARATISGVSSSFMCELSELGAVSMNSRRAALAGGVL